MKLLKLFQRIFGMVFMCPFDDKTTKWSGLRNSLTSVGVIFFQAAYFLATLTFVLKNFHLDLRDSLFALYMCGSLFTTLYTACVGILLRNQLHELFSRINQFYEECESILNL